MGGQRIRNPLGVMQGRLLPKYKGHYQAHPVGYWSEEFPIAADLGLDCIEFILDFNEIGLNPLLNKDGRQRIRDCVRDTGVQVLSICADYFMKFTLHHHDIEQTQDTLHLLQKLLKGANELGVWDVVIPCVDQSSIRDNAARERFRERLEMILPLAERLGVNLSLETDLNPTQFGELLSQLDSPRVTVNYDIGNSVALGFDPAEELSVYGERISDIHIKDRVRNGGPVQLGTGDADIPHFIQQLQPFGYQGPLIMQTFRDEEGITIFTEQLQWVQQILGKGV